LRVSVLCVFPCLLWLCACVCLQVHVCGLPPWCGGPPRRARASARKPPAQRARTQRAGRRETVFLAWSPKHSHPIIGTHERAGRTHSQRYKPPNECHHALIGGKRARPHPQTKRHIAHLERPDGAALHEANGSEEVDKAALGAAALDEELERVKHLVVHQPLQDRQARPEQPREKHLNPKGGHRRGATRPTSKRTLNNPIGFQ